MTRLSRPALAFALVFAAGCGGAKRAEVSGKVTLAGKGGLPGGGITFISVADEKIASSGVISADGSYRVADAPVGECKVLIDNTHLDPNVYKKGGGMPGMGPGPGGMPGMKGMPGGGMPKVGGGAPADAKAKMSAPPGSAGASVSAEMGTSDVANQKFVKLDPAFSKADSTTLRATVSSGSNEFNFEVK